MILFINVFITNQRKPISPPRKGFQFNDRFDMFKYMLASHSVIDWSKVVIYAKLDKEYLHRQEELENWISDLFGEVSFYPYRSLKQREWQAACEEVLAEQDDLIWFLGNDDHIFLDSDLVVVNEMVELLNKDESHYKSCFLSHWPESMRWMAGAKARRASANFVEHPRSVTDAIQVVNKSLLKAWWFDGDWGDEALRRSDDIMLLTLGNDCTSPYEHSCYVPLKEIMKHMDASPHLQYPPAMCPPMTIPHGFFERTIKINYGKDRKGGWVNIDPAAEHYFAVDPRGTDYKWLLKDVPLFWKDRIDDISVSLVEGEAEGKKKAIWNLLRYRTCLGDWIKEADALPPEDWVSHLFIP